ncbi:hypothetical protein D3C71_79050 [compost metagenome]
MKTEQFTLDCEFDGYQGRLLSIALFNRQRSFYGQIYEDNPIYTPWVYNNVVPFLDAPRHPSSALVRRSGLEKGINADHSYHSCVSRTTDGLTGAIQDFLNLHGRLDNVTFHSDWPDDVKYLSELLLTGPGTMIDIGSVEFKVHRVDSYPSEFVQEAVRHNAWWDTFVLFEHLHDLRMKAIRRVNPEFTRIDQNMPL